MLKAVLGDVSHKEKRAMLPAIVLQRKPKLTLHKGKWAVNGRGASTFTKAVQIATRIRTRNMVALGR